MKKIIFLASFISLITIAATAQSVYEHSFRNAKGDSVSLSQYRGKKILIIIAPHNENDTLYRQLEKFKEKFADSIVVIGIPSIEAGFQPKNKASLSALYTRKNMELAEGMKTSKNSGSQQSLLMQWLTDVKKNRHFNNDAVAAGQKFFISESGRLYAVMGPLTSLQSPIIDRIVRTNPH